MKTVIDALEERGFIEAMTSEALRQDASKTLTVYAGFDPTADSLHIGNLVGIIGLGWFQRYGHKVVAVIGGATGMIGDPSGKSAERNLLDQKTIEHNLKGIARSLAPVLKEDVVIVNNFSWFKDISCLDFLREIGKHFRLGPMLAKDSVRSRLESEEGISYTEFSYQLLQAYDFLYLNQHMGVTLQIGGSDQWGNITAGCELIRKLHGVTVHGLTFPLLVRSDGKKFGKTEEGTIWLNADKLSPYDFYQYFYRIPDNDVVRMMRMLTFMEMDEIRQIESELKKASYVPNQAQSRLAEEITRLIHGEAGLKEAIRITKAAAPGAKTDLDLATLEVLAGEIPSQTLISKEVIGCRLVDLVVQTGMITSKGEVRRLISNGGVYLNNEKITDEHMIIHPELLIEGRFLLLGIGKKKKMVVKIEPVQR